MPNSIEDIGGCCFSGCNSLSFLTIPNSVINIGSSAFDDIPWWKEYSQNEKNIYDNIVYINDIAYKAVDKKITSCNLKYNTISIGGSAFEGCTELSEINIPNSVRVISDCAFYGCENLTVISIPDNVTIVDEGAFWGCQKLSSVSIGKSVNVIEDVAFYECPNIRDVYCYAENIPYGGNSVFDSSIFPYATLYVPFSALEKYKNASPWHKFGTIQPISSTDISMNNKTQYIITSGNGNVVISGLNDGEKIDVYSTDGKHIATTFAAGNAANIASKSGETIILKIGGEAIKVIVK